LANTNRQTKEEAACFPVEKRRRE